MGIDTSHTILVAIILMFLAHYLYNGRKETKIRTENIKMKETIFKLEKQITELQSENTNLHAENEEFHKKLGIKKMWENLI